MDKAVFGMGLWVANLPHRNFVLEGFLICQWKARLLELEKISTLGVTITKFGSGKIMSAAVFCCIGTFGALLREAVIPVHITESPSAVHSIR